MLKKGFTLIELLVVIGIMAVLMAGVVALIDPVDKNNQAMDSQMQSVVSQAATAEESYAAQHGGCYAASWAALNTVGELKTAAPVLPSTNYAAPTFTLTAGSCTAPEYGDVVICATLKSKKYVGVSKPIWKYEASTGKTCNVGACGTACP